MPAVQKEQPARRPAAGHVSVWELVLWAVQVQGGGAGGVGAEAILLDLCGASSRGEHGHTPCQRRVISRWRGSCPPGPLGAEGKGELRSRRTAITGGQRHGRRITEATCGVGSANGVRGAVKWGIGVLLQ